MVRKSRIWRLNDPASRSRNGDRAAQDRRDLGRAREIFGQPADGETLAPARQPLFGQRHELDHALISLLCGLANGEDAVLQKHEPFDFRVACRNIGHALGQREARNRVGHIGHAIAEDFARHRLAVRLIGQREHGGRMCVVDEFVRQEGVQQRLD